MILKLLFASLRLCGLVLATALTLTAQVPAPKDVIGFTPGDDRKLASWASIVDYFKKLDAASDRVMFQEIGKSTMGAPFVYATISSPANLKNLEKYKQINAKLADPRTIRNSPPAGGGVAAASADGVVGGPARDAGAKKLIAQGKTIVLITCGIHSTEVGSTLSSMLIAHKLASSSDADVKKILDNTIILLVPSLNPDGVDIVKNWYDKTLGTKFEGTEPPELYHKYVGHDNNRDWYAFTQVETQLTVDKIHNVWHPQIVHDIHQQSANGARLFLPPYMQPVEPNVPKQIVEGYTELGNYMAADLRKKGFEGITTGTSYDAWTPARAYSHYHGGVRILSETASARLATPVKIEFERLRASSEAGFDPKIQSATFGPVWRGGEWKLANITDYMTTAAFTLLNHAADNRERWLSRFYEIGKEAVNEPQNNDVHAIAIKSARGINWLLDIFRRGGVEIENADKFSAGGRDFPAWTRIIRANQPYFGFAKALLEKQQYPTLTDGEGNPIPPYDVTAHTLTLLFGTEASAIATSFQFKTLTTMSGSGSGSGSGRLVCPTFFYSLYRSNMPSMDEGWSRWTFENYGWQITKKGFCQSKTRSVTERDLRSAKSLSDEAVIIFPDQSANQILNGYPKGSMPDEYTGGVGKEGVENLRKFVENGGTLVFLNRASNFAIDQFDLPVKDVTRGLNRTDFFIPGSILRTELDTTHPIAKGMPKESIAWFENSPAFEIQSSPPCLGGVAERSEAGVVVKTNLNLPNYHPPAKAVPLLNKEGSSCVRIIATYPKDPKQILLSGWALGAEKIAGKAALVEFTIGKGKIVLFGFRPQYRGQSLATFPLLFNAISQ